MAVRTSSERPPAKGISFDDEDVDVVVARAGNGGLSAAIAAAERGSRVLVVEIDSAVGGSSAMSDVRPLPAVAK